jgi:hypothetical protein
MVHADRLPEGEATVGGVMGTSRVRRVAFYAVVGLLVLGLAIQWWVVVTPVLVWFPDDFVNDFFASRLDEFAIHRIHRLALALSHVIILVGLAIQFQRPQAKEAAMWQVSAFFVTAIVLNLIIGPTAEQVPPPLWIIFSLGVLAGVLHPTSPILRFPKVASPRLLALTAALAVPVLIYVFDHVNLQVNGVATDPHWESSHYQFIAEFGLHLILLGCVASTVFTGRRLTTWMAGLAAVVMGSASVVFSEQTSSLGIGWGLALAVWGLAFIVVGRSDSQRGGTSDPSEGKTAPATESMT